MERQLAAGIAKVRLKIQRSRLKINVHLLKPVARPQIPVIRAWLRKYALREQLNHGDAQSRSQYCS
jgi:hypothetical protein